MWKCLERREILRRSVLEVVEAMMLPGLDHTIAEMLLTLGMMWARGGMRGQKI